MGAKPSLSIRKEQELKVFKKRNKTTEKIIQSGVS